MIRPLQIGVTACVLLFCGAIDAGEPIGVKVRPAVCFAPAELDIRVTIEPHGDNRALEVVADSLEYYRSSTISLDGDRAPRTFAVRFRNMPGGEYDVEAILRDAGGDMRASVKRRVNVIPEGADD